MALSRGLKCSLSALVTVWALTPNPSFAESGWRAPASVQEQQKSLKHGQHSTDSASSDHHSKHKHSGNDQPNHLAGHYGWNIAALLGMGFEVNHKWKTIPVIGPTLSYAFPSGWEVGVEYEPTGEIPTLGLDVNYYLSRSFFVGIQSGLDFAQELTSFIGPQAGYDYAINSDIIIGPEIQFLQTFKDRGGILAFFVFVKHYF